MNTRQHYRDALKFILRLRDAEGRDVGFPTFDFRARFHCAGSARSFTASCIGGQCVNCHNHDGRLEIVCADHGLPPGQLLVDFHADIPDSCFPDGRRPSVRPLPLDLELTIGPSDLPTAAEVEATVPFIVRGLLESEAPLLGEILDRVNSTFDAILGPGGATPGAPGASTASAISPTAPRYLQRGIISIYARPGVVYRHCGQIRLPGNRRIFDLSGIPSIETVSAAKDGISRPDLVKYDGEARTVEIFDDEDGRRPDVVRVNLNKPSADSYYIMKMENGHFMILNRTFPVEDIPLEAPVVPRGCYKGCFTLQDVLDSLPLAYKIEVQKKERHYRNDYWGKELAAWHRRHKIMRVKDESGCTYGFVNDSIEGSYIDTRGVFRIRYVSKKKKSAWTIFSIRGYYLDGESHAFVALL